MSQANGNESSRVPQEIKWKYTELHHGRAAACWCRSGCPTVALRGACAPIHPLALSPRRPSQLCVLLLPFFYFILFFFLPLVVLVCFMFIMLRDQLLAGTRADLSCFPFHHTYFALDTAIHAVLAPSRVCCSCFCFALRHVLLC